MELAPKRAGFAPERINRITDHLSRNYIEPGKIAGCQVAVARHGHLAYSKSFGQMDRERGKPMADDAIFRIYSMTKPITSVALMIALRAGLLPAQRSGLALHSRRGATTRSGSPATAPRWRPPRPLADDACATCSATPAA